MPDETGTNAYSKMLITRIKKQVRNDEVRSNMIYNIKKVLEPQCMVCGGYGHTNVRCATKKRIKHHFYKLNCHSEWKDFVEEYANYLSQTTE